MSENRTVAGQPRSLAGEGSSATTKHRHSRYLPRLMIGAAIILVIIAALAGYVEQWLWMRQVDYVAIFWTLLSVQCAMFCSAFAFAFLFLWINLRQLAKDGGVFRGDGRAWQPALLSRADPDTRADIELSPGLLKLAVALISAAVALFFAASFYAEWDTYLRFRYGGSFGVPDPLFGVDVGFYVFHLPFYVLLQSSLTLLTVLTLVMV